MLARALHHGEYLLLWGFIATCAMSLVQEGSQIIGLTRMSFPFLAGTFFTGNRRRAEYLGFALYIFGGWIFALLYALIFESLGYAGAFAGGLTGLLQGLFLLAVALPILPSFHPRMASPYDGPEASRRIDPPGMLALNYGKRTPLVHIAGQIIYGAIIGATYPL